MSRSFPRPASGVLIALVLFILFSLCLMFLLQSIKLSPAVLVSQLSDAPLPDMRTDRPLQALYQLEVSAAQYGWTSPRLVLAGDLWRAAGDMTRAVAYWEAAEADATVLYDRADAYIMLNRWPDAADTLARLLTVLPPDSIDRPWAEYQLGLIRLATDPAAGVSLLQSAQSTYGVSVTSLLASVSGVSDPTRIGIALANAKLWSYAELAFSQASGDPVALAYGGWVRDMQGKDGAQWITLALELAPQNAQVRFLDGLHLRLTYDYPGSLKAITQAVALQPDNPALYAELGKAYQLVGDLTSAEHWLKYAVSLDKSFQPLLDQFYSDEAATLVNLGLTDASTLVPDATPEATSSP